MVDFSSYSILAKKFAVEAMENNHEGVSQNSWTQQFENEFASFVNYKHAVAMNSGTSALHAALFALNISKGDEVIVPGISVVMDAFTILNLGGIPVWVDVEMDTWNLDVTKIEERITPRTKGIISISWFGLQANNLELSKIAKKYNLFLLDDSAETIHISNNKSDLLLPDIKIFSFEAKKHFSTGGEGGMLVTNSALHATQARKYSSLGYKHLTADLGRTSLSIEDAQNPEYERFDSVGLNYRMTPIAAAIGLGQLRSIKEILQLRKINAGLFLEAANGCSWLTPQIIPFGFDHTYYSVAFRYTGQEKFGLGWRDFYFEYKKRGGDGFYGNVKPPYLEPVFRNKKIGSLICNPGLCPIAEKVQEEIMAFKTNYRDLEKAKIKSDILSELIDDLGRN